MLLKKLLARLWFIPTEEPLTPAEEAYMQWLEKRLAWMQARLKSK